MSDARREARGARFDEAIDRAVREMLDVEPPADLHARVMAQLPTSADAPLGKSASGFRLPASGWVLAPLAAAAIIVLGIFLARRSEPLPQAPVVAKAVDRYLAPEAARQTVDVPVAGTRPAPPVARRALREPDNGIVVAAAFTADDPESTQIAPLNRIAPISVAAITQDRITPADMAVRPLNTIAEIQIAPLTPADRRN